MPDMPEDRPEESGSYDRSSLSTAIQSKGDHDHDVIKWMRYIGRSRLYEARCRQCIFIVYKRYRVNKIKFQV
uniref:Uncharacterized protein n=1 Tax=Anopheles albimanus TaxID=7167 RepID=A0A182FYN5_ANOAL